METFLKELKQFRRGWLKDLLRREVLESAGWFAVCLSLLCWLDLYLGLPPRARVVIGGIVLAAFGVRAGMRLRFILRTGLDESAAHADRLVQSRRREVLSALEVGFQSKDASSLSAYLSRQGIETARNHLKQLENTRLEPLPPKVLKRFALCLCLALVPALLNPRAALVLLSRYGMPFADIPPYSAYEFHVSPESPRVVYGDDQVIHVAVTGKKVTRPVRFATRKEGHILESACFQASPDAFVQRLERVMQPMEFCFILGKARSPWHRIEVLYQPHVVSARVRITPPAYARKPEKVFVMGSEPLQGLKGSRLEMAVQSNRPLKNGELTLIPSGDGKQGQTVQGRVSGQNEITFDWELSSPALVSVMIKDIQGTPAKEPMKIRQDMVPDEKPEVILAQPLSFSLATPTVKVPISAGIEDDLGIRGCDIFRSLKGYRCRAVPVDLEPETISQDFSGELDLARLGVQPGDVIELFLEASDTNPELTGTGASDIARIKIISEDDYAEMIRARTTIDAFQQRFHAISTVHQALIRDLEKAKADLEKGLLSDEQAAGRMKQIQQKIKAVAQSVTEIAGDFAAFDLEKKLSQTAQALADKLDYTLGHEGWNSDKNEDRIAALAHGLKFIKGMEPQTLTDNADEVAAISRVLAMSALYKALMERQLILVRSLNQYASGDRKSSKPKVLSEHQAAIRKDLDTMADTLSEHANALPPEYESLRQDALDFASRIWAMDIDTPMKDSEKSCINEEPREAFRHALKAYERMEDVLNQNKGNCMSRACSGGIGFHVPDHLSKTLSQMLDSLMNQFGQGTGTGMGAAGMGMAGAFGGSYMNGYSAFNVPFYGPRRRNPGGPPGPGDGADGQGTGSGVGRDVSYHESVKDTGDEDTGGAGFSMDDIPPRYRDAVKSFYSGDTP